MNIDEREIENWINFPRYLKELVAGKYITRQEFHTYIWIRLSCDRYGKTAIGLGEIREEVFGNSIKRDTVYCYFKSLKDKGLIYYEPRHGIRGNYLVYLDDFLYDKERYTNISKRFNRNGLGSPSIGTSEESPELENNIRRLKELKNKAVKDLNMNNKLSDLGGDNNG